MKNSKVVNILFLAAGALVWFLSFHYLDRAVGYFQLSRHLGGDTSDVIRHGLPLVLGAVAFFVLRRSTKASHFVSDSVDELIRVVFPGPREVRVGTFWVITLVLLAGVLFGVLDMGITSAIRRIIGA